MIKQVVITYKPTTDDYQIDCLECDSKTKHVNMKLVNRLRTKTLNHAIYVVNNFLPLVKSDIYEKENG